MVPNHQNGKQRSIVLSNCLPGYYLGAAQCLASVVLPRFLREGSENFLAWRDRICPLAKRLESPGGLAANPRA